jgi:hypothetical protein
VTQSGNSLHALGLVTDRPSVNFANAVDPREGSGAVDYLQTYADLAEWTARAGVVSRAKRRGLCAGREPEVRTLNKHSRVHASFAPLYRIFSRLAMHRLVFAADLALLRAAFRDALFAARLEQQGQSFRSRLGDHLELIRWKVARDAVAGCGNRAKAHRLTR